MYEIISHPVNYSAVIIAKIKIISTIHTFFSYIDNILYGGAIALWFPLCFLIRRVRGPTNPSPPLGTLGFLKTSSSSRPKQSTNSDPSLVRNMGRWQDNRKEPPQWDVVLSLAAQAGRTNIILYNYTSYTYW